MKTNEKMREKFDFHGKVCDVSDAPKSNDVVILISIPH